MALYQALKWAPGGKAGKLVVVILSMRMPIVYLMTKDLFPISPWVGGISGGSKGAYSVALSGGYNDDVDLGYAL